MTARFTVFYDLVYADDPLLVSFEFEPATDQYDEPTLTLVGAQRYDAEVEEWDDVDADVFQSLEQEVLEQGPLYDLMLDEVDFRLSGDDEVYASFLEEQKQLQADFGYDLPEEMEDN